MKTKKTGASKKEWTIAVYMAGDNDLDGNGYIDLREMKTVGSTPEINIVAQLDSARKGHRTTRYVITKGAPRTLANDAIKGLGKQNTGDPSSLIDFVNWACGNYPARRYALVLWNHGQGWDDSDIYEGTREVNRRQPRSTKLRHSFFLSTAKKAAAPARRPLQTTRAILLDDNSKDFLDNIEMQKVAKAAVKKFGGKIELFGMDACLMNQLEVAYQLRKEARFIVGSELTEPLDGWPYHEILGKLAQQPTMKTSALASIIVDDYITSYSPDGGPVTQSAVDVSRVEKVVATVDGLAKALITAMGAPAAWDAIQFARMRTQKFDDNLKANVDLGHFCELLGAAAVPAAVKTAASSVLQALKGYVIRNGRLGKKVANARGVSIYFPTDEVSPLYSTNLDFAKNTAWKRFLDAFVAWA